MARDSKAAREASGLSQRALSDLVGVPQSHISKIEKGGVDRKAPGGAGRKLVNGELRCA